MGLIYRITNKLNGKMYVGQTTRTLEIRIQEHLRKVETYVERAIAKYGIDNFEVSVIEECDTLEKLNEREIYWISFYDCIRPKGYNICTGGNNGSPGHTLSAESRAKISKANKGRKNPISPETRQDDSVTHSQQKNCICKNTRKNFCRS